MNLHKVSDYRENCPKDWADDAYFMSLHDTEAMWISFHAAFPVAILVGAGGVNALTGQKLGTKLEKDNYLVCPPQPWFDGWKDVDGTVHQFIATPHRKGEGITVAEQIIGSDSKTGAIGLAVFDSIKSLKPKHRPYQGVTGQSAGGSIVMDWVETSLCDSHVMATKSMHSPKQFTNTPKSVLRSAVSHVEMGLGKGGKIVQKIYEDPHGIKDWKDKPTAVFGIYLVDAKTASEITGESIQSPVDYVDYTGPWFGLKDEKLKDVVGASIFSSLKSATNAFPGDVSNVEEKGDSISDKVKVGA